MLTFEDFAALICRIEDGLDPLALGAIVTAIHTEGKRASLEGHAYGSMDVLDLLFALQDEGGLTEVPETCCDWVYETRWIVDDDEHTFGRLYERLIQAGAASS